MQNNSEYIEILGRLAHKSYNNDNFVIEKLITPVDGGPTYTVVTTHTELLSDGFPDFFGFQALLLEELDADGHGTNNYVIAFRGTEVSASYQCLADFLSDGSMALGNFTMQMKLALMFVKRALDQYGSDGLTTANLTFTGHSLGGALAELAGYTFGSETYAYNPFGIENVTSDNEYTDFLAANSISSVAQTINIHNIIALGGDDPDYITGQTTTLLNNYLGEVTFVKDHTGGGASGAASHGIAPLNESIAVYNNILTLFPDEDYSSLTEKLDPVAPQTQQVERFLETLSDLMGATASSDHIVWSENIKAEGVTDLTLTSLATESTSALQSQAATSAGMYALLKLNPFTIAGADYSHLHLNGELDRGTYSEQYIEDRSTFLYALSHKNENYFTEFDTGFIDDTLNISADVKGSTIVPGGIPDIYAWGNGEDPLYGGGGNDHLYGTQSNDTIDGSDGDDILEGGKGQDTMYGGSGNDTFYVQGFDDAYDIFDGGRGGEDPDQGDIIQGSDGDDGIRVHELTLDYSIEKIDGGGGINFIQGTTGNDTINLTNTEVTNINAILGGGGIDNIIGSDGDDTIIGGESNQTTASQFRGGKGNDTILADSGRNILFGGSNHDLWATCNEIDKRLRSHR